MRSKTDYSGVIGRVFHRLTVLEDLGIVREWKNPEHRLRVRCICGVEKSVSATHLIRGKTKSCGCLRVESAPSTIKHGMCGTPSHKAWCSMKERCLNPNNRNYHRYGGRGIKVCERWLNSFENFISDMGIKPEVAGERFSLGRIDNDGDYTPENCRWEDETQQANNTRTNVHVTYRGKTQTIKQWCRELSLPYPPIVNRIKTGWDIETALTTPVSYQNISYGVDGLKKSITITFRGQTKTIKEWASEYGLDCAVLRTRYVHLKWPVDENLFRQARPRIEIRPRKRKGHRE